MAQEQFLTRLTVCELPDETERRAVAWAELIIQLRGAPTDILVLPEMPFVPWTVFTTRVVDPAVWQQALADHDSMVSRDSASLPPRSSSARDPWSMPAGG